MRRTKAMILCALFAALAAVGAFLRIPVPMVPFTLQFLFTNLAGLLLGSRLGAISVGVYVLLGLMGLPVFTGGGGIGYVVNPTFGYLVGFVVGAWLAGWFVERRRDNRFTTYLWASFLDMAVVFLLGMLHYFLIAQFYLKSPVGLWTLFATFCLPFLPGDFALSALSAVLARRLRPVLQKQ